MTPQETTERFVAAINAHDIDRLIALMTLDHRFIDSLGAVVEGRDAVREGWKFYFGMVPDYGLEIRRCFMSEHGATEVMLVGMASGSYQSNCVMLPSFSWATPVALRAVVRNEQIAEWQVYADNEPIREQMRAVSVLKR